MKKMLQNVRNVISNTLEFIGKSVMENPVFFILIFILGYTALFVSIGKSYGSDKQMTKATVMITRLTRGGGTGVIYRSSKNESSILTNAHVCAAVKDGGVVNTSWGEKHLVTKYAESTLHDVCMIYVQADLGVNTNIADSNPTNYTGATVSGHPNLLPVTITKGFFADKRIIQVFMGVEKCTDEQMADKDLGMLCLFFGGIPRLKTFDSRFVTATIMAGSSGSAVYNSAGEIGGLVFAGSGDLSYAFTVPYEFVANFVENEAKDQVLVEYSRSLVDLLKEEAARKKYNAYISEKCKSNTNEIIAPFCKTIIKDLEFRKEL